MCGHPAPAVVVVALCTPGKIGLDLEPAEHSNLGRVMVRFSVSEEMCLTGSIAKGRLSRWSWVVGLRLRFR